MGNTNTVDSKATNSNLIASWQKPLAAEFSAPYMLQLKSFLQQQKQQRKIIYPKARDVFSAFNHTPLEKVRVVLLGQDPYHGPDQAHGMCFSVLPGVQPPPSLKNIYKELEKDLGVPPVKHGYLMHWADQGVFLLNSVLTVEQGKPGSHRGKGWEQFTDQVIRLLNAQKRPLIFVLWGSYAQAKGHIIDAAKHVVLRAAHPSPFSAHSGFFGCKHFSKINQILTARGEAPIDWQLPIGNR